MNMKKISFSLFTMILLASASNAQNTTINGSRTFQTIHGLGVNINPQSWNVNPESVKKVLDSLVTEMGCTSFRLMYDDCDWETVNDNNDPDSYNWTYYDSIYSLPRFTCVWNTVQYLNSKGITDITLSPDGAATAWMGGTKLNSGSEREYAEMMASMVNYGIKRHIPVIHFSMLSPINETTCGGQEGTVMTPTQLETVFSSIARHLINDDIGAVTLIGPDDCDGWAPNLHVMISDSLIMSKLVNFGCHEYGNSTEKSKGHIDAVRASAYPDKEVIMTEANTVCKGCDGGEYNSDYGFDAYAGPAYKYILQHLNVGVTGIQLWEGYDSRYHHPNRSLTWSMWGIFAVNDTTHPDLYTHRPHFYVFQQLFRFVKPGFRRIDISSNLQKMTLSAFYNPANGAIVITGKNDSDRAQTMEGMIQGLSNASSLSYYYTDATHNFSHGPDVRVSNRTFSKVLPAFCVFTLVSK
jgi:O-glycosyl hydrolase